MRFQDRQPGIFCLNEGWKFTNEPFTVFLERKKHNETYAFAKAGGEDPRRPVSIIRDGRQYSFPTTG